MAAKKEWPEKSIRVNMLGGFNRRDVVDYIQALVARHKEENAAYTEAADRLRKERNALRDALSQSQEQAGTAQALQVRSDEADRRVSELSLRLAEHADRISRLTDTLEARDSELTAALSNIDSLRDRLQSCEAELEVFHAAKLKAADMELAAYQRAEAIEQEAAQEAEIGRQAFLRLIGEARQSYDAVRRDAQTAVSDIQEKLAGMDAWLARLPACFADMDHKLDAIPTPEKPLVKAFSPVSFDGSDDASDDTSGDGSDDAFGDASDDTFGNTSDDTSGDAFGDTFGNASDDAFGNASGDAFGNASGDTFGNASGDAFGNASDDAFGNASGDASGDAFGPDQTAETVAAEV